VSSRLIGIGLHKSLNRSRATYRPRRTSAMASPNTACETPGRLMTSVVRQRLLHRGRLNASASCIRAST
jgi:hypothetical protein